ncbi:IS66 family transposase (plasmid) [Psychrobium sp. nBUS_13]|uniref:IS66 family transposase n=1 Tax=Psychrobium sp. nBUS_13 TaxID=3395319 RepID=UPI003EB9E45F
MKFDANSLPNDPEQLKSMLLELQYVVQKQNKELAQQKSLYQELLDAYNAKIAKEYGKKSEKMPGAGEVFNEVEAQLDDIETLSDTEKALLIANDEPHTEKAKPKRTPLPEALPRKEVVVDLHDDAKVCSHCQSALHKMGEAESETLEFVPAHIKVIKTVRPKYACRACEKEGIQSDIQIAPMPSTPIPKSIATPSLLSQIITCKYQFGLPLYRQETWFGDIGITINRKTMSSWMVRCSELLEPLYDTLKEQLLQQPAIHADETPLKVIKANKATSYMWLYCCGDDKPEGKTNIVLFDYHNSRAGQCAIDFLDDYSGYMHVDGYKGYEKTSATLVACLAHIRRKFIEAKGNNKTTGKADVALNFIGKLYGIEQSIKEMKDDEKYKARQQQAKPIVEEFYHWLVEHKEKLSPQRPLSKAITYALNQYEKFKRYLDDGKLSIDNNRAERAIKPFVIGRKAWLFSHTPRGAKASAILYSLVETAKANGLVVHDYISHCLEQIAENPDALESLMPWNFK